MSSWTGSSRGPLMKVPPSRAIARRFMTMAGVTGSTRLGLRASYAEAPCEPFDQPTQGLSHGAWCRQLDVSAA